MFTNRICYDPVTLSVIGGLAVAGGVGASSYNKAQKKEKNAMNDAVHNAQKEAEQKALADAQTQEKTNSARRIIASQSTAGFGPNTNLARSFLTTL